MGTAGSYLLQYSIPFFQAEDTALTRCRALQYESAIGSPGQFGLTAPNFTGPGVDSTLSGNALQLACLFGSRAAGSQILNSGFGDSFAEVLGDADELLQNNAAFTAYQAGDVLSGDGLGIGFGPISGIGQLTPEDINSWCDLSYVQHNVNLTVGLDSDSEADGEPLNFVNIVNPSVGDPFTLVTSLYGASVLNTEGGPFNRGLAFYGFVNSFKQNLLNLAEGQAAVVSESTVSLTSQSTPVSEAELEAACKYGLEAAIISKCELAKNFDSLAEFSYSTFINKALDHWCDGDGAEFSGMAKNKRAKANKKGKKAKKATSASSGTTVGAVAGVGGFVGGAMVMAVLSRSSKKPTTARKVVV